MASESCGGGDKPCQHADHGIYWMMQDVCPSSLSVLRRVKAGVQPTNRFETAFLVALDATVRWYP